MSQETTTLMVIIGGAFSTIAAITSFLEKRQARLAAEAAVERAKAEADLEDSKTARQAYNDCVDRVQELENELRQLQRKTRKP